MFNIFKSNKMENLISAFAGHMARRPKDPMTPEWIGVQSRGMKQWISARLADEHGICANTRFLFPKHIIESVIKAVLPQCRDEALLDDQWLFWAVLKQIMGVRGQKGLERIEQYTRNDRSGKKQLQLARRIARCFDNYLVYRPDVIQSWQQHPSNPAFSDPDEVWQAELWHRVISDMPFLHIADMADRYLTSKTDSVTKTAEIPSRISFFGIFSMPPLFLQVFDRLSRSVDVNLFVLSPSDQYYFDARSLQAQLREELKQKTESLPEYPDTDLFDAQINPLVASLAGSGRDFFLNLESFNYHEPLPDLYQDPVFENETMLARIQSDIFNLETRRDSALKKKAASGDRSISIHSCHSPMRETQVLKDLLMEVFETRSDLFPHDVIVMMPDIEAYSPFIESVFSNEHPLPFSISDRRKRSESQYLEAFLAVLALKGQRMDKILVVELLSYRNIRRRFGFETAHLAEIEQMVEDAGILWAMDKDHRERLGLPGVRENTWQFGLERLFMGMALPEDTQSLVFDIFPSRSCEGQDLEILGKLARFSRTLFDCLSDLEQDMAISSWVDTLVSVHERMMAETPESGEDRVFLFQSLESIRQGALKTGFEEKVSFDLIHSILQEELDKSISQGSFPAGRITFCNIMPMRSIPYKVVALMGMDEMSFPRRVFSTGFDLMQKYPRPGDKNERNDDRYLFLETILSAREQLIITYTGQDIRDNSKLPCAGVVSELIDVMQDSFSFDPGGEFHHYHKLHPFNSSYFTGAAPYFSYSRDNLKIAAGVLKEKPELQRFLSPEISFAQDSQALQEHEEKMDDEKAAGLETVTVQDLSRFFKNPARWLMQKSLNVTLSEVEKEQQDREPYLITGLDQYKLGQWMLDRQTAENHQTDLYPVLKAMGALPFGRKGKTEFEKLNAVVHPLTEKASDFLSEKRLDPLSAAVDTGALQVRMHITDVREKGLFQISFGRLNGARMLDGWIRHLVLNASAPKGYPLTSRLLGRDPEGKKPVLVIEYEPLGSKAQDFLESLAQIYCMGQVQPVAFFVQTAFVFARQMQKCAFSSDEKDLFKALSMARPFWAGGFNRSGEREDRYVKWCFPGSDPLEKGAASEPGGFADTALAVFQPMLTHMKALP